MIEDDTTYVQAQGNGVTSAFSYPNKIFLNTDLVVSLISNATGAVTTQTLGTQYYIPQQWIDNDEGSQVQFETGYIPASGYTVDIRSDTPETQLTSIKNQGSFLPELHEEAFDKITRAVQDLYRLTYLFGIHGPDSENIPWDSLPAASTRANTLLGFGSTGQPICTDSSGGGGSSNVPVYTTLSIPAGESDNIELPSSTQGNVSYAMDVTAEGAASMTGFVPQFDGQFLLLTNVGTQQITLTSLSANSTIPIRCQSEGIILAQYDSLELRYSAGAAVWIALL